MRQTEARTLSSGKTSLTRFTCVLQALLLDVDKKVCPAVPQMLRQMGFWWLEVSAMALLDDTFATWEKQSAAAKRRAKRSRKRAAAAAGKRLRRVAARQPPAKSKLKQNQT